MRALLDEMPDTFPGDVKAKMLDCRTALDFTPYLLACRCGHTEVASMLVGKGCDITLMNSSGKTGKKLADAFQREVELSHVHPWNRANELHLVANNLESFLGMLKAELNEHVRAGMKVWNSKQMVWKLSNEQMRALEAAIRQLVHALTRACSACAGVCVRKRRAHTYAHRCRKALTLPCTSQT